MKCKQLSLLFNLYKYGNYDVQAFTFAEEKIQNALLRCEITWFYYCIYVNEKQLLPDVINISIT